MSRPLPLDNKSWGEIQVMMQHGQNAYYVERDGWYTVVLPSARCQCEFPCPAAWESLDPTVRDCFNPEDARFFEAYWKRNIRRSELSDPVAS